MKNVLIKLISRAFFLATLMVGFVVYSSVSAQTAISSSSQELGIAPFLQELQVDKGGTTSSYINLSNTSSEPIVVNISTKDFLPGKRGQPQFVPDEELNESSFSLASWIKIKGKTEVTVPANSVKQIEYNVQPPINAEQGTHYGAILFSYLSDKQLSGVEINQSVGSIILVSYGEARSQGTMQFTASKNFNWWNDKIDFTNTFFNTGNVHVKPKGEITIKNIFGQVVSSPSVNRDAANVLPKSDRTFITTWQPGPWSFGRYRAESVIIYGKERLEIRAVQIIWVLPLYILFVIGILFSIIIWYVFYGRHWHKRRIINKHLKSKK